MANNSRLIIVSLIGVLLFTIISNATSSNNVVSTICPKTSNLPFCSSVLKSAGTTDLKGLAIYTLNLAHTNARKSLTLANSLAKSTTNPQLKQRYFSCAENYDEAVGDIENAQKNLALGDFNAVNIVTSGAMTEINDCQDKLAQPSKNTLLLLKNGKTINDICNIILVVSNLLRGLCTWRFLSMKFNF
ncbi:pectinesterase inhibitor-like [Cucumis melo var. makuwa]|uniref:Pectinesterase inhibitor-like n=1 Tax=Cucumis melo var. makuwa TaxID=1194695 RepID=A0A5D3DW72_CUCMM|nr:pectinesterase inhibitor-like [Cucumis melo var. makuwa]TYK27545.1 pectinesterase inhibitor-like [Cucumis melo var. makuwa]